MQAITFLHLRMFEMASDFVRFNTDFEVCGGYLSPVWTDCVLFLSASETRRTGKLSD